MTEQVIRHRGSSRDEDGEYIEGSDSVLEAFGVAPGASQQQSERAREGENIACTVYFTNFVDLTNADEMTVRGERFAIIVDTWSLDGRGGLEVLCTRGQG